MANISLTNYSEIVETIDYMASVFNIFYGAEFIVGTILNALTIIVCMRNSLRKIPSFVIVTSIAIANLLILNLAIMPSFIEPLTGINWGWSNLVWCKFELFFNVFTYNLSGWLLVKIVLLAKILSMKINYLKKNF